MDTEAPRTILTDYQVAELIGCSRQTLKNWRTQGKGPPWFKLEDFARYDRADVLKWIEQRRVKPAG